MLDPRRNLAATAAGLLGLAIALVWVVDALGPEPPGRIVLLATAIASLVAGAWPSRRVRFVLLIPVTLAFAIAGVLDLSSIGIPILLAAAIAACGLVLEYFREGRD